MFIDYYTVNICHLKLFNMKSRNLRVVVILTVSIFLVENIFLFLYLGKWRKEKEEIQQSLLEARSFFSNKESSRIEFISLLDYLKLNGEFLGNISLSQVDIGTSERKAIKSLYDVVSKNDILFRFSQFSCPSCVTEQIDLLSKVQSKMGSKHILLFTDVLSDQIREYLVSKNLPFSVFELGKEHLTIYDNEFVPYLCVVNEEYQIVNSIPVSKEIKQYAKYFYQSYENKYCNR